MFSGAVESSSGGGDADNDETCVGEFIGIGESDRVAPRGDERSAASEAGDIVRGNHRGGEFGSEFE